MPAGKSELTVPQCCTLHCKGLLNAMGANGMLKSGNLGSDVHDVLRELAPDEQRILRMRFGLGTRRRSNVEISGLLGWPSRQVLRTQMRALRHLRAASADAGEARASLDPPPNLRAVAGGTHIADHGSAAGLRLIATKG